MNLKLIKGHYKDIKDNLNYDLFGEYMKIVGKKKLFKGGFGHVNNVQDSSIKTKKVYNPLESLDHKYQIYTIIKRYNETIKHNPIDNYNRIDMKSRNSLIQKKSALLQPMKIVSLIHQNSFNIINNISLSGNTHHLKKNNTSCYNILSPVSSEKESNLLSKVRSSFKKTTPSNSLLKSALPILGISPSKAFKDPFINYKEDKYFLDKSLIKKRLEKNYHFFESNKNKYTTYKNSIAQDSKYQPKQSLLRIRAMLRRDNNSNSI